jgi:hypothetical protein
MPAYEATPAGDVRRAVETGSFKLIGNAAKMAAAMIASAERSPAPRRLVMGSTSYVAIRAALESRLVELDAQKERKQWDGRPHPKTASKCHSGSVSNHSIRKERPPCDYDDRP